MTHRSVETLIGRLVTDPALRQRFSKDRAAVLREFCEQGHELTSVEQEGLAATDPDALRALADALDRRIRKLDPRPDLQEE
jgi:hypothetical protein